MNQWIECATQAEFDAAIAADDVPIVRSGNWWASGSATVTASGSATVTAYDSATVTASGSATVTASGSATVTAYNSATVTASGSATVRASGSATVTAYGSATVRAYDLATVRASALVPVHDHGPSVKITGGIPISVRRITDPKAWCEFHGLTVERGKVTVFKAVEADWRGGTKVDGITYAPGDKPEAPDWAKNARCGAGLHFVARPWEGGRYLDTDPAHYVACVVRLSEMAVIDQGKVKCRRVVAPITECDIDGEPLPVTGAGE